MKEEIYRDNAVLALTDENLRLVNINLLLQIKKYNPFGIKGVYEKLHTSLKGNDSQPGKLSYEAMRAAIRRDLNDLNNLANAKADELHSWLKSKRKSKYEDKLQIKISDNQFLLNNILHILGMNFSDLFDKKILGIIEDEYDSVVNKTCYEDIDKVLEYLVKIEKKINNLAFKINSNRIYKTYEKRFSDFILYKTMIETSYIINIEDCKINNQNKLSTEEIHGNNYIIISCLFNLIHKNNAVHNLFNMMKTIANDDIMYGRLLDPLFLIIILFYFIIKLLESGMKNNLSVFHFLEGNFNDTVFNDQDNKYVIEMVIRANDKTINLIKHIQKNDIIINEKLCVMYELLFKNLFKNTNELFLTPVSIFKIAQQKCSKFAGTRKKFEAMLNSFVKPIMIVNTFGIKKEQLNYLETFIDEIETLQIELDPFYKGNYDVNGIATTGILPDRSS
jgi:hypothetical protein